MFKESRYIALNDRLGDSTEHKILIFIYRDRVKAKANRHFRSAGNKNPQSNGLQILNFGKELKNLQDIVLALALVQGIHDKDQLWRYKRPAFQQRKRLKNKPSPLVA